MSYRVLDVCCKMSYHSETVPSSHEDARLVFVCLLLSACGSGTLKYFGADHSRTLHAGKEFRVQRK